MTLQEWLSEAERRLAASGIESARFEAQLLAAHALGKNRSWVLAHPETSLEAEALDSLLGRRERREPLAYIIGFREFFGRDFEVSPAVLIPRQETEVLVEACLRLTSEAHEIRVLDIGTGSGCIAITLQLERPDWKVWAADISQEALAIAQQNAKRLGTGSVQFVQSDLFGRFERLKFDLIVSNPPYVAHGESLMPEVGLHEPREALFAGPTGVEVYARMAAEAPDHLNSRGRLIVEIGVGQELRVQGLFQEAGWRLVEATRDLSGIVRVLAFELQN
ncbi:MAG: peptide chain release factor N(5)-glutamine methyltransferase [Armatimonadetes bacterium]|nr:peptide chain release factor N(5)-glutamine methyltransferase [Armatimonadota bacterium]